MRHEIFTKIANCRDTSIIDIARMNIGDNEIYDIVEMIKKNQPKIRELNLDNNLLSDRGAQILSKHLAELSQLMVLSIQYNQIGRAGAIELFSIKRDLNELDILFNGNKITDVGEMMEIEDLSTQLPASHNKR